MLIKLTEEQLQWILKGSRRPGDTVISMYRDHYVHGIPKSECSEKYGLSPQFAYKKWMRFDHMVKAKCAKYDLVISTVLHKAEYKNYVLSFDIINREPKAKDRTPPKNTIPSEK